MSKSLGQKILKGARVAQQGLQKGVMFQTWQTGLCTQEMTTSSMPCPSSLHVILLLAPTNKLRVKLFDSKICFPIRFPSASDVLTLSESLFIHLTNLWSLCYELSGPLRTSLEPNHHCFYRHPVCSVADFWFVPLETLPLETLPGSK